MSRVFAVLSVVVALVGGVVPSAVAGPPVGPSIVEVLDTDEVVSTGELARRVATQAFGTADRVVVARQDDFPDALAAGSLLGRGPLLLVGDALNHADRAVIADLGAGEAVVLGGVDAVPAAVEAQLADAGLAVTRLAGATRVETAVAIAETALTGPKPDTAILLRGEADSVPDRAFADALAAGGLAAATGWPVLLTGGDDLAPATADHVVAAGYARAMVIGGTEAVTPQAVAGLPDGVEVVRLAGDDRHGTALRVAELHESIAPGDGPTRVIVVDDADWPAAFTGAALAGTGAPIVLNGWGADALPSRNHLATLGSAGTVEIVCLTSGALCDVAWEAAGGAATAMLGVDPAPGSMLEENLTISVADRAATIDVSGGCLVPGQVDLERGVPLTLPVAEDAPAPSCTVGLAIPLADGSVQREHMRFARPPVIVRGEEGPVTFDAVAGDWLHAPRECGLVDPSGVAIPCGGPVQLDVTGTYTVTFDESPFSAEHIRPALVAHPGPLGVRAEGYATAGIQAFDAVEGMVMGLSHDATGSSFIDVAVIGPDGRRLLVHEPEGCRSDRCLDFPITQTGRHVVVQLTSAGTGGNNSYGFPVGDTNRGEFSFNAVLGAAGWVRARAGDLVTLTRDGCADFNFCPRLRIRSLDNRVLLETASYAAPRDVSPVSRIPASGLYLLESFSGTEFDDESLIAIAWSRELDSDEFPVDGAEVRLVTLVAGDRVRVTYDQPDSNYCGGVALLTADAQPLEPVSSDSESCRAQSHVFEVPYGGRYLVRAASVDAVATVGVEVLDG